MELRSNEKHVFFLFFKTIFKNVNSTFLKNTGFPTVKLTFSNMLILLKIVEIKSSIFHWYFDNFFILNMNFFLCILVVLMF